MLATHARCPDPSSPPGRDAPLGLRLWHRPMASWMAAATLRADGTAEHATRLYERAPSAVVRFIDSAREARDHADLETLFRTCSEEVRACPA